ncbi:MAG: 50S ribosomal protein L11 methyltransferase [Rhodospirillales bacterium]|tara:strand:- start:286 stop:1170 length:885 start_codon:yes stop_codon:yes gene_type:complete
MTSNLNQISFTTPKSLAPTFADSICDFVDSVSWKNDDKRTTTEIIALIGDPVNELDIKKAIEQVSQAANIRAPKVKLEKKKIEDLNVSQALHLSPIRVGRFVISGGKQSNKKNLALIRLNVPAGEAFGSGRHETTKGCIIALNKINKFFSKNKPRRGLDMGSGSGILAMVMAKLWNMPIIASDIDPISTRVCNENLKKNGLRSNISAISSDGYNHRRTKRYGYDIVVSNILARPLVKLSRNLAIVLRPGGIIILSGFLIKDKNWVMNAHLRQRFYLIKEIIIGDWVTLVMRRPQ